MSQPVLGGPAGSRAAGAGPPSNLVAIAAIVFSMAGFGINDALVKLVAADLPLSQVVFVRGVAVNLGILALILAGGHGPRLALTLERPVLLRGATDIFTTYLYLIAILHMPLGNAAAILNAAPLVVTAMSVVFLGEVVRGRRWAAVAAGFTGVVMVAQPGTAGFNIYALLVLAAAISLGFRDLVTLRIAATTPSLIVTFSASLQVTAAAGVYLLAAGEWRPIATHQAALILASAALVFVGYHFTVVAVRAGALSVVAPFRYSIILWAMLMGFLIWRDVPNLLAFAGIALIIASGVYVFHREYVTGRGVLTEVQ